MNATVTERATVSADRIPGPWWKQLPVSVNCAYGDPLIKQQEQDTTEKLRSLAESGHLAPFGFCTKGVLSERAADLFAGLPANPRYVFRYSLTGLDEAGYKFEKRRESILRLGEIFGPERVIISPRPIIKDRNDDEATLARIVDVAAETSRVLIIGGLHDAYKHKLVADRVDRFLRNYCDSVGVRYFYKSSCSSAFVTGAACWMHDLGDPVNTDALDALGFHYTIEDGEGANRRLVLSSATTGDLNFVRTVTASLPTTGTLESNYNLLTRSPAEQDIEHTSSWYVWARNLPQCLNCDYCIINDIEYLEQQNKKVGVHPDQLASTLNRGTRRLFASLKGGEAKVGGDSRNGIDYTKVRVVKECRRHAYDVEAGLVSAQA